MYSVGRDAQGKLPIMTSSAERIDLLSRYKHKLFWLVASSLITGHTQWKLSSGFQLESSSEFHMRQRRDHPVGFSREGHAPRWGGEEATS